MSNDGMDRFLQRMRSDLMFELRKIEHGERPVTGQNHRANIQHFMEKHVVIEPNEIADGKHKIPLPEDSTVNHRPESIVVEVQGIIEQRPVSSILQSASFRRQLENVIRGTIQHARRETSRNAPLNLPQSTSASSIPARNRGHEQSRNPTPEPFNPTSHERPQLVRHESTESIDSFSSAISNFDQDFISDQEDEVDSPSPEVAHRPSHLQQSFERVATPAPETQNSHRNASSQQVPLQERQRVVQHETIGWNEINRIQRDELVEEISELLHNRLVSSTLDGEFRARLELHMQDRVASSGTNGQAVEEFIQRLPRTGVPRNDFSHLGIPQVAENEQWDNISVTSVSAHSVPYVQTNTYLSREIQGLKSQMNEMKNMLKLTFDLQMDIQRAIRQEVAAAMNNITGSSPVQNRPISDTHCLICLERHTDTVLYQCGHMCVCYVCGRDLVSRGHNCPVCRAPIKDVIRAYKTNAD
ncbi:unnamed protein product [Lymnaea stagnalis]|uniref:RING-type domain-containing protein n=1 Tax=Lymnaea stagnalis TaxID=6523 RepID=A0AAV2H2G0_LYMST